MGRGRTWLGRKPNPQRGVLFADSFIVNMRIVIQVTGTIIAREFFRELSYPRYLAAVISWKNLFAQATDGKGLAIESSRHFAISRIQIGAARSKGTFQVLLLELFSRHVGRTFNRRRRMRNPIGR